MTLVSLILLAGGNSRRMGRDKGMLPYRGMPLAQWILRGGRGLAAESLIIANAREAYLPLGYPVYPDVRPGLGALGGIYSALHYAQYDLCLIWACDMPFIQPSLVRYLLTLTDGYDVVLPLDADGQPQPFCAVYRRTACLQAAARLLDRGEKRVQHIFDEVSTRRVPAQLLRACDPNLRSFINWNTPQDVEL